MTRTRYASMGMLGLGIGHFLWYTPSSALAKAMSGGLLPSMPTPIGGLVLPAPAAPCAMPVTLTAPVDCARLIQGFARGRLAGLAQPYPAPSTAEGA